MIDRALRLDGANRTIAFRLREFPLWGSIAIAAAAAAAMSWPTIEAVWGAGEFFDTDDAMRAVQVRDLLAGQSWFDMTAYRLDPPQGMFSHWSRVVDAPLAALELIFRHFLSPEAAERLTRLVFPFALLILLLRLCAWCATILWGSAARHAAVLSAFLTGAMFMQFIPGRIDHHAPQIALLMASLCFFLTALQDGRARAMMGASATMALSFAISLENLPFFAVIDAALLAFFIIDGVKARGLLGWFAAGALLAFPLFFAATVSPARYLISACDAYSAPHLAAAAVGSIALFALAALAQRLTTWPRRLLACAFSGAAVFAAVAFVAPQCLGDPFVELDPLLRDLWLSHVKEARPLFSLWREQPGAVAAIALPVLIGLAVALAFAVAQEGAARRRWAVVAAAIAMGFAAGLWQVRAFTSIAPIAATSSAIGAVVAARRLAKPFSALTQAFLATALCLASSPMGIALALPANDHAEQGGSACFRKGALAPLARLAPARIAAPIDMGAFILESTPHSVFAAPYHRDNHGARLVVDAFLAEPDAAEGILRGAGADLVVWCETNGKISPLVERSPAGLAAALSRGTIPGWLEPMGKGDNPVHVFAVRRKE
jgi:hypothetical protein